MHEVRIASATYTLCLMGASGLDSLLLVLPVAPVRFQQLPKS